MADEIRAEDHLGLVRKLAYNFLCMRYGPTACSRCPIEDTEEYADGCTGLMHAVKKYKPELGWKLATYAAHWINRDIRDGWYLRGFRQIEGRTPKCQERLFTDLTSAADEDQIDQRIAVEPNVEEPCLDTPGERMEVFMACLDWRAKRIVFKHTMGKTLAEIGDEEKPPITRERVRQLLKRAIVRMRMVARDKGIPPPEGFGSDEYWRRP